MDYPWFVSLFYQYRTYSIYFTWRSTTLMSAR